MKLYKERHVYFYTCKGCGREQARTFKRRRTREGLCRPCRKGVNVDQRQTKLL